LILKDKDTGVILWKQIARSHSSQLSFSRVCHWNEV